VQNCLSTPDISAATISDDTIAAYWGNFNDALLAVGLSAYLLQKNNRPVAE
jgi:hypothetical protein